MDTITSDDKPDLERKSEAFAAVKGAGIGAVIGTVIPLAVLTIPSARKSMNFEKYSEGVKKLVPFVAGASAIADGALAVMKTQRENDARDLARSYVDKLESDRDKLTNLALNGGQRS